MDRDELFSADVIRSLRTHGALVDAAAAFAAWLDHGEQCTACTREYRAGTLDEHYCAEAVTLFGTAISANGRAMSAQQPPDYHDAEEPSALLGQPWRAPAEVAG